MSSLPSFLQRIASPARPDRHAKPVREKPTQEPLPKRPLLGRLVPERIDPALLRARENRSGE